MTEPAHWTLRVLDGLRAQYNEKPGAIASMIGVPAATLAAWMRGDAVPSVVQLEALAGALGCALALVPECTITRDEWRTQVSFVGPRRRLPCYDI